MRKVVVGVDPGLSGGICMLAGDDLRVWRTPFVLIKDRYARPVLDLDAARRMVTEIERFGIAGPDLVMIEVSQIRMKTNSRKTVSGIWWYAGIIDAMFRMCDWPIEYVQPKQWQAYVLDPFIDAQKLERPTSHDGWKKLSKDFVKYHNPHPENILFPPSRAGNIPTAEHEGTADAYCIATFADANLRGEAGYHRDWMWSPTAAKRIRKVS